MTTPSSPDSTTVVTQFPFYVDLQALAQALAPYLQNPSPGSGGPPPPPTTSLRQDVYRNGVFSWQGDYSWGVSINYADTSLGSKCISVSGNGGFQPYANNFDFDTTGYNYLVYSVKATLPGAVFGTGVMAYGDKPVGTTISDIGPYGAPILDRQWNTYKIPLGTEGLNIPYGTHIYKFWIQDRSNGGSGTANNLWYVDNIYFTT